MEEDLIEVIGPMGHKVLPKEEWEQEYKGKDNWYTVEGYQKMKAPKAKKKKKKSKSKKEKSK